MRLGGLVLGVFVSAIAADHAQACANLTPVGQRRQAEEHKRYLATAERIVRGQWYPVKISDDGQWIYGRIEFRRGQKTFSVDASAPTEINCGFPNYPYKESEGGTFYVTGAEIYTIIHFAPGRR